MSCRLDLAIAQQTYIYKLDDEKYSIGAVDNCRGSGCNTITGTSFLYVLLYILLLALRLIVTDEEACSYSYS